MSNHLVKRKWKRLSIRHAPNTSSSTKLQLKQLTTKERCLALVLTQAKTQSVSLSLSCKSSSENLVKDRKDSYTKMQEGILKRFAFTIMIVILYIFNKSYTFKYDLL